MPCATSAETPIFLGLDWAEAPIPLWHIAAGSRAIASHAWEGEWLVRRTSEAMPVGINHQFKTISSWIGAAFLALSYSMVQLWCTLLAFCSKVSPSPQGDTKMATIVQRPGKNG